MFLLYGLITTLIMERIECDILAIVHRLWIDGRRKTGGLDMVLDYWLDQGLKICTIEHPLEDARDSFITIKEKGQLDRTLFKGRITSFTGPLQWLGEAFFNIKYAIFNIKGHPLLATSDLLNNAVGIFLPGKFRRFYFHCVDYSANRFGNFFLNIIYKILLQLSFRKASLIGVVSSRTRQEMIKQGARPDLIFHLPNSPLYRGFDYNFDYSALKIPFSILYSSTKVIDRYCYKEAVEAVRLVKKSFPQVILRIIGKTDSDSAYLAELKEMIKEHDLEGNVEFLGYLEKDDLNKVLRQSQIGLALHAQELAFYYHYADPLKVREYAAFGLPTVTDNNSSVADDVITAQSGIVANGITEIAQEIVHLFKDSSFYNQLSQNARQWAKNNDKITLLDKLSSVLEVKIAEQKKVSVLYIVSYYGFGPLNYLQQFLKETDKAEIATISLPPIRLVDKRLVIKSSAHEADGKEISYTLDWPFSLPAVFVYPAHYILAFWVFYKVFTQLRKNHFDICIAEPCFNTIFSWLLRAFKFVTFTIFVNGDIIPERKFGNDPYYIHQYSGQAGLLRWAASLFHQVLVKVQMLFRHIGYNSDLVWCITDKIAQWDREHGLTCKNLMVEKASFVDYSQVERNTKIQKDFNALGYIGRLNAGAGIDLLISTLPLLVEKVPNIKIHFIGGSDPTVAKYKKLAQEKGVSEHVVFYGFIPDLEDAFSILAKTVLGMALYDPTDENGSSYTQSGKLRDYLKAGLPIIATRSGSDIISDLEKFNAGVLVDYNPQDIVDKIFTILSSLDEYTQLQQGVLRLARDLDYHDGIIRAWQQITSEFTKKI